MKKLNFRYQNLIISKYLYSNQHSFIKINKIFFTVQTKGALKFIFKNLIWLLVIISGQKIHFKRDVVKRKTSSKTYLSMFGLTIRNKNFSILEKILAVVLPNQENRILTPITWNKNLILNFKKCLTYGEVDLIIKNRMSMLIKNFNIVLNFSFSDLSCNKNFFVLRFLQCPIKKKCSNTR